MSCATKPKTPQKGCKNKPSIPDHKSYEAVVADYKANYHLNFTNLLGFYTTKTSLSEAIKAAANGLISGGRKHHHQYRLKKKSLAAFHLTLKKQNFSNITDFEELHSIIKTTALSIPGIGVLMVYDAALRISAYLRIKPQKIYLHAGTAKGANAMGLGKGLSTLSVTDLPKAFHCLSPAEAEDCLCIFKENIAKIHKS